MRKMFYNRYKASNIFNRDIPPSNPSIHKNPQREIHKKKDYLNEKFGSRFSWQKMGKFLRAAEFEDMKDTFTSSVAMIAMKQIYKHRRTGKKI